MKNLFSILWLVSITLLFANLTVAQTNTNQTSSSQTTIPGEEARRRLAETDARNDQFKRLRTDKLASRTQPDSTERFIRQESLLLKKEKALLMPNADDRKVHDAFLKQEGTGFFKILPSGNASIIAVSEAKAQTTRLPLLGGGAYYSFNKRSHDLDQWADIFLQESRLNVGITGESLGIMTILKDIPLQDVTLDAPELEYLKTFIPPVDYLKAEEQYQKGTAGFTVNQLLFKSTLPAIVNATYVLRSIKYKRADILIAFRIIRQDEDGSLHILWKLLQKYPTPNLKAESKKATSNHSKNNWSSRK